jgi:hypothetical protein
VPNVWGVLKPSDRPKLWRRVSAPQPAGLEVPVVMGFDTDFQRAYDKDNLGWKYDPLQCGDPGTQPQIACVPADPEAGIAESQAAFEQSLGNAYKNIALLWNIPLPQTSISSNADIENRKIYNTYVYSQSNGGHEFTAVLTDDERRALIESLKTL